MSFFTSLTGLNAAQTELATVSNNIANTGTNGFKKSRVAFGDIIASSPLQNPARVIGSGVAVRSVAQQFQQGAIETSDNALYLVIRRVIVASLRGAPQPLVIEAARTAIAPGNQPTFSEVFDGMRAK